MPVQILSLLLNDRQAWQHRVICKSHCRKSCQVMRPHQGLNMLPDALLALVRVLGAEDCRIAKPNEWCLPFGKEIPLAPPRLTGIVHGYRGSICSIVAINATPHAKTQQEIAVLAHIGGQTRSFVAHH